MVFDTVIIEFICDADKRVINPKIEDASENYTLSEVERGFGELIYRRAMALGWDYVTKEELGLWY
jgi:hypothetical protein